jgi:thiamine biosynthesis lipoprotein
MVLTASPTLRARVRQSVVRRIDNGLEELTFLAMGTRCRVLCYPPSPSPAIVAFQNHLLDWVADFEARYSRFLDDSLISRINAAAGRHWVEIDEETDRLFALCGDLFFFTKGAFDPTALPLLRLWNWKRRPAVWPADSDVCAARELVGWGKVQRRPGAIFLAKAGMGLDLGGVGKEYAVDMAMVLAGQHGVADVLVDFGQDVRVHGAPPGRPAWHVGLEDPRNPGSCWAGVAVTDHAVASSGDYLRHFLHEGRRYGHIIDPRTGYPVNNACRLVSVIAPSCTIAGILSTTAFILGPQEGYHLINQYHGASGAVVTETGNLITPRFYEHLVRQN